MSLLCVYMLCLSHAVYLCWCVYTQEALVFGSAEANQDPSSGRVLTATDVAVAAGLMELGDTALVSHVPKEDVTAALRRIREIVEDAIDSVRVSDEPLPVILVGGGSTLLDLKVRFSPF